MCLQNLKFVALPVPEIIGGTQKIWAVPGYAIQGHPRSLNLVPTTNQKRNFLLARHSNHGPILHRFGDIAEFLCSSVTPPLFHPIFWVFPLTAERF